MLVRCGHVILCMLFYCIIVSCRCSHATTLPGCAQLYNTVNSINRWLGSELTTPYYLFRNSDFNVVYNDAAGQLPCALVLFQNHQLSNKCKEIIAVMMWGLDDASFIQYTTTVIDLCKRGIISEDLALWALLPSPPLNSPLIKSYSDGRTRRLLNELRSTLSSSNNKAWVDLVINGDKFRDAQTPYITKQGIALRHDFPNIKLMFSE